MSKPNKDRIDTNASGALTHNPFSALISGGSTSSEPADSTPQPEADSLAEVGWKGKPGRVVLRKETAHRGGKSVIVVDDFAPQISLAAIEELSRRLRKACGCGGAVKERRIELQGDQPERVRAFLQGEGFRVAGV